MESNAWARFRCSDIVRVWNTAVTGFAGGPAGGCWAVRLAGRASTRERSSVYAGFMGLLGRMVGAILVSIGHAAGPRNVSGTPRPATRSARPGGERPLRRGAGGR